MKYYSVSYYDGTGGITSVMIPARNEKSVRNKFTRDYGYYTIIMIEELKV